MNLKEAPLDKASWKRKKGIEGNNFHKIPYDSEHKWDSFEGKAREFMK